MTESLRVGIVGLGGMGRGHAKRVRSLGHRVAAGADVAAGARAAFAERFDADTYESHDELYDDGDVDAVLVATPNAFHRPAVEGALERDVPVLCEKPLADDLADAEAIAAADDDSRAFCMVGFHNRFSTAADLAAAYREAGRFGDVTHVEAAYVRRRGIPGVGSWFTDRGLAGGGAVVDIGVHLVDFALYLAGFPEVVEVSAVTRSEFGGRPDYADPDRWAENWRASGDTFDVEDSASAFCRCGDGTTLSLEVAWAANRDTSNEVRVRGTDAGARCAVGGEELTLLETGTRGDDHYVDSNLSGGRERSGHEAEIAAFLDGVAAGERPALNTVEEGLAVQRVLDGVYRSADAGAAVSL